MVSKLLSLTLISLSYSFEYNKHASQSNRYNMSSSLSYITGNHINQTNAFVKNSKRNVETGDPSNNFIKKNITTGNTRSTGPAKNLHNAKTLTRNILVKMENKNMSVASATMHFSQDKRSFKIYNKEHIPLRVMDQNEEVFSEYNIFSSIKRSVNGNKKSSSSLYRWLNLLYYFFIRDTNATTSKQNMPFSQNIFVNYSKVLINSSKLFNDTKKKIIKYWQTQINNIDLNYLTALKEYIADETKKQKTLRDILDIANNKLYRSLHFIAEDIEEKGILHCRPRNAFISRRWEPPDRPTGYLPKMNFFLNGITRSSYATIILPFNDGLCHSLVNTDYTSLFGNETNFAIHKMANHLKGVKDPNIYDHYATISDLIIAMTRSVHFLASSEQYRTRAYHFVAIVKCIQNNDSKIKSLHSQLDKYGDLVNEGWIDGVGDVSYAKINQHGQNFIKDVVNPMFNTLKSACGKKYPHLGKAIDCCFSSYQYYGGASS